MCVCTDVALTVVLSLAPSRKEEREEGHSSPLNVQAAIRTSTSTNITTLLITTALTSLPRQSSQGGGTREALTGIATLPYGRLKSIKR